MSQLNIGDITLTNSGALQGRVAFAAMQNGSGSGNIALTECKYIKQNM